MKPAVAEDRRMLEKCLSGYEKKPWSILSDAFPL